MLLATASASDHRKDAVLCVRRDVATGERKGVEAASWDMWACRRVGFVVSHKGVGDLHGVLTLQLRKQVTQILQKGKKKKVLHLLP